MTPEKYKELYLEIEKAKKILDEEQNFINEKFIETNSKFKKYDIIECKVMHGFAQEDIRISIIKVGRWNDNTPYIIYGGSAVITIDKKRVHYRSGYGYNEWIDDPRMYELKLSKLNNLEFIK